ncbi:MAG TPA: stage II sporulation protein M [Gaiellales bacterium]
MASNSRSMISADPERTWSAARAPLWDELSDLVDRAGKDQRRLGADEVALLARRYQQAAADLARLRVSQPSSPLLPRLNDLVARAHAVVYRPARTPFRSLGRFLWTGYPQAVWDLRRLVAAAAAFQIVVAVGGFIWGVHDPATAGSFLPPELRDAGHRAHHAIPAGVMAPTSVAIWSHNIVVSFYDYAGGILFGLGTIYSLYFNSMLLGVLSGVESQHGANGLYWSLIVPHGVIELTAFTITAAAGLSLADALIRARPQPRMAVLAEHGRRSVAVVLGTMPLLVIAGTIEGFVTPSSAPIPVKLAVAPISGVLLGGYLLRGRQGAAQRRLAK